jgi:predicted DsbA family dithiol-disulfide isomerase
MPTGALPELWQWVEYFCPWSYITAVRLDKIAQEYQGRVRLVERAFPLEVYGGGVPPKAELDQEWWLAALQEPTAAFAAYRSPEWPTTTLPAFEAVWCARQQDETAAHRLDLRIRRAFFAESANLSRPGLYPDLAREVGLEMPAFDRLFESSQPRAAVLAEGRLGKEKYGVSGTPTVMGADGKHMQVPLSEPHKEDGLILSIPPLTCCGETCYAAIRALFEQVMG